MNQSMFESLAAQGYHRIALCERIEADLDTPIATYLKAVTHTNKSQYSFLLESVVGGERSGRFSFVGLPASTVIKVENHVTSVITNGECVLSSNENPLDFINHWYQQLKVAYPKDMPRFCGGLCGYFSYDSVRFIEKRLSRSTKQDPMQTPDIFLTLTEELLVIDNLLGELHIVVYVDPQTHHAFELGQERIHNIRQRLNVLAQFPQSHSVKMFEIERDFNKADYLDAVAKAKAYIEAGDIMQVQIGQRLRQRFELHPLLLYRALRRLNPSPYMYYYDYGDFQIVGASPEILVRMETDLTDADATVNVAIRPLAGTRPRGSNNDHDLQLEQELVNDPKERAEHVMLIDLARNDIGRVCEYGTVKVTEQFVVERYSHVMHMVSHVEGKLQKGINAMQVLKASFPAGTLSGAPKVRAMEIIEELEPVKRGIYGGAVGYWSFSGVMDLAIAIRTGIVKDKTLYVQAAAGIVADSIPEKEWQETEHKASALLRATEQAQVNAIRAAKG